MKLSDPSHNRRKSEHVLILSDIEGSSGCWDRAGSKLFTPQWRNACIGMSLDVNAVAAGLLSAGVKTVTVKDFHRTGYNLIPELIDSRVRIIHGYSAGPVPGIGHPGRADSVMMIGLHAASGTGGFLPHTLTSRIASLKINGKLTAEVTLFSASLAPFGVRPIFFSGCPDACAQARSAVPGIDTFAIDKDNGIDGFDADSWRYELATAAVASLSNNRTMPLLPQGPFRISITFRDGRRIAEQTAEKWGFSAKGGQIVFDADHFHTVYMNLIRICYLTPLIEKALPIGMAVYRALGLIGLRWVKAQPLPIDSRR